MSRIAEALDKAGAGRQVPPVTPGVSTVEMWDSLPDAPKPTPAVPARPPASSRHVLPTAMATCADNERLVVSPRIDNVALQQYRKLAGTLHQIQIERALRSVLVTSAAPGEGKSVTATNLALTLSESFSRRVLLIDADLRRPSLHALFGARAGAGLSDVLSGRSEGVATLIGISDRLSLLPAGNAGPDPSGAFSSEAMQHLLAEAGGLFDWIIVDSPPLGMFPDSELLSTVVDGVLMVIRAEYTRCAAIRRAMAAVSPERVLGAVLNRADAACFADIDYYDEYERLKRAADASVPQRRGTDD